MQRVVFPEGGKALRLPVRRVFWEIVLLRPPGGLWGVVLFLVLFLILSDFFVGVTPTFLSVLIDIFVGLSERIDSGIDPPDGATSLAALHMDVAMLGQLPDQAGDGALGEPV